MPLIEIDGYEVGPEAPPFIVAELSANHRGDLGRAKALIDAAKEAGAQAVKLQTYTADTITIKSDRAEFRFEDGLWAGRSLYELYEEAHTPWDWHEPLFSHARDLGLAVFSSPFDPTAVDFLETLGCPAYKIASFEIVDIPLIRYVARLGKPVIISTGMATLDEIKRAVQAVRETSDAPVIVLHCTSGYPTPADQADLRTIPYLADELGVMTGLSDHTRGVSAPVAAVALGAVLIEKHFTISRAEGGVDAEFSLEPDELHDMVDACTTAHAALGRANFDLKDSEVENQLKRRSLYVTADVGAGEPFTPANVRSIRPGLGLEPRFLDDVLGKHATRDLSAGQPLDRSMIADDKEI